MASTTPKAKPMASMTTSGPMMDDVSKQEINSPSTPPVQHEARIPKWRLWVLIVSVSFGLFLSIMDTSIVATTLYSVGTEFHALQAVNWIALAYTLAYVGCAVLFARLSDVIGRRNAYVTAALIFFAFSFGSGFSQSLNQLIAFRALQGVGGSGLYSLTFIILPEVSPLKVKKQIGSIAGIVLTMAGVLGPVIGGLLTHYSTWRWVFWINPPILILPLALFIVAWPKHDQMVHSRRQPLKHVDVVGAVLLVAASVLVVFSFQEAGIKAYNGIWNGALFLAPLLVGILCWALLFAWSAFGTRLYTFIPLMPARLFKHPAYAAGVMCTITSGYVYYVMIYLVPIHLQIVYGKSSVLAGVGLLPMLGSSAIGVILGGALARKSQNIHLVLTVAASLQAIGCGCLSLTGGSSHQVQSRIYGLETLPGFGFGLTVASLTTLAMMRAEPRDHATAQGIMAQARVLGGSIGIAASTAITGVIESHQLRGIPLEIIESLQPSSHAALDPEVYSRIRKAYNDSFSKTMWVTAIIACVGFLFGLLTYQRAPPAVESSTELQEREGSEDASPVSATKASSET